MSDWLGGDAGRGLDVARGQRGEETFGQGSGLSKGFGWKVRGLQNGESRDPGEKMWVTEGRGDKITLGGLCCKVLRAGRNSLEELGWQSRLAPQVPLCTVPASCLDAS